MSYILVAIAVLVVGFALVVSTLRALNGSIVGATTHLEAVADALGTVSEREDASASRAGELERELSNLRALISDIDERVEHRYRKLTARDRRAAQPEPEPEPDQLEHPELALVPPSANHAPQRRLVRAPSRMR